MRTHKRNRRSPAASRRATSERSDRDAVPERQRVFSPNFRPILLLPLLLAAALIAGSNGWTQETPPRVVSAPAAPGRPFPSFDTGRFAGEIALVFGLICVNAFFAIAEVALITVRKTRIRQLVEEGNRSAILVEKLLAQPTRLMATIQTGITLVATLSAAVAAVSADAALTGWLQAHGIPYADVLALLMVTLPVAVLTLVVGEIAPKSVAMRHSERLALLTARPVYGLQALLTPIVYVLDRLANVVVRPFGGTASFTTPAVNEEELKMMVEASEEQGVLEAGETEMIHSILNFGDTVVRKVMTPRIDVTAQDVNAPMTELVRTVGESGHSRIPVYDGDLDNIVGIVHAKDLLTLPADRDAVPIRDVMRAPYFIPETKKVDELLTEFRRSKQQLAIVRDEYGLLAGLITIEDLLEEIVGDIQDEYDVEEPQVQVLDSSCSILDGRMSLSDVNERMGLDLPEDEADTIGGFVFGLLGHQAVQGERVRWKNVEFVVEATDGRRIEKVRLIHAPEPDPPPPETDTDSRNGRDTASVL